MGVFDKIFCELSGGCDDAPANSGPVISAAAVERAQLSIEAQPAAAQPGPFVGAGFHDLWLNVAESKWTAEQRFVVSGSGLYFARDGSAPDVVLAINAGRGTVRLSPGMGFTGAFDAFTVKLISRRRQITRHDARLVVVRDPTARFVETAGARARFRPVPLLGGDRLLNEAGEAIVPGANATEFSPQGFTRLLVEMATTAGGGLTDDALILGQVWRSPGGAVSNTFSGVTPINVTSGFSDAIVSVEVPLILAGEPRMADEQGSRTCFVYWDADTGTAANLWISGIE